MPLESDRVMVAFGYHGDAFHGSQVQPGIRTVEGSLRLALERLGWWSENCLEISSRTDAGVSVRMNLARIDLPSSVSGSIEEESAQSDEQQPAHRDGGLEGEENPSGHAYQAFLLEALPIPHGGYFRLAPRGG